MLNEFQFILYFYNIFLIRAIDVAEHFTLNQSKPEEITLTEDYENSMLLCDRDFGERS